MDKNKTAIAVVLDRSSSMSSARGKTIEGFNTFLTEQKKEKSEATLTLVQFNTSYEVLYVDKPLKDVPDLTLDTYMPSGSTALLDAIGRGITELGEKLRKMKEDDRPGKVLFVIITDGEENSSKEFRYEQIREMIKEQTEKYNWIFAFMGADINAYAAGSQLGIAASNVAQYHKGSSKAAYGALSRSVSRGRDADAGVLRSAGFFSADDKKAIETPDTDDKK